MAGARILPSDACTSAIHSTRVYYVARDSSAYLYRASVPGHLAPEPACAVVLPFRLLPAGGANARSHQGDQAFSNNTSELILTSTR
jgi:hypothetical protein